jgi:membrane-bound serine protease (ClpP class)
LFIPSGGILFVLAVCGIVGGVTMTFYHADSTLGWLTLLGVFVLVPVIAGLAFHYWPKTPMGKRFFLKSPDEDATVASMPVNLELEELRGQFGKTVSALRPAGVAEFRGRRVDVLTEGIMVDPGQWIQVIDVKAGRVVVRPVDKPDLRDLESADFG